MLQLQRSSALLSQSPFLVLPSEALWVEILTVPFGSVEVIHYGCDDTARIGEFFTCPPAPPAHIALKNVWMLAKRTYDGQLSRPLTLPAGLEDVFKPQLHGF